MRIRHIIGGALVLASALAAPAQAFTGPGGERPEVRGPQGEPEVRGPRRGGEREKEIRKEIEDEIRAFRLKNASFTAQLKERGDDAPRLFKERRQEIVTEIQQKREEFQQRVRVQREELKTDIEARKAALKERLAAFKDRRKGEVVQRLDGAFASINVKWVGFFTSSVNRIENVLDAVSSRADKAQAAGKDVAAVRAKIEAATAALASARAAIEVQAGKDYTVEVSSEESAKTDVSGARKQLGEDLQAVRAAVRAAHDATKAAAKALKDIPGIGEIELETSASTTSQ